jgi:cyclohexadienyl dehydratase
MESMALDLASPGLPRAPAARSDPRRQGQKRSGGGRLENRTRAVKSAGGARVAAALGALLLAAAPAGAEPAALRVGTSGDYAPFSAGATPGAEGFDLDVARAFAEERGLELEVVRFRWPDLERDLAAGRFDVAMSGVTVRPERSIAGRFSVAVAEAGAVAIVADSTKHATLDALDESDVRIGVNAGGHLEQAARLRFPHATLVAIPTNPAVPKALAKGLVDAVVSDDLEAPAWLREAPDAELLGSFTRDRKAYLVRADRADLAADLDAWLLAREADGTLARLRRERLGGAGPATAAPLAALAAAIDERLALMPLVAAAKQRLGLPIEAPAREQAVMDQAVAACAAAARAAARPVPPEAAVRGLFAALVEAAKEVQRGAPLSATREVGPDLEDELRPALSRIGERVAFLLVRLPPATTPGEAFAALRDGVRTPGVSEASLHAIADAIAEVAKPQKQPEGASLRRALRVACRCRPAG